MYSIPGVYFCVWTEIEVKVRSVFPYGYLVVSIPYIEKNVVIVRSNQEKEIIQVI